jgi:hypothetical protein
MKTKQAIVVLSNDCDKNFRDQTLPTTKQLTVVGGHQVVEEPLLAKDSKIGTEYRRSIRSKVPRLV